MHDFSKTFRSEDERYMKLINITGHDLDIATERLNDIHTGFDNLIGKTRNHPSNYGRVNRSLLSLANLVGFIFSTASNSDIKELKKKS